MNAGTQWRTLATCQGLDGEIFFPAAESGPTHDRQVATAKAVCARCPVRAECLDEALLRIPDGIAGGLTADERRAMRRRITTPGARTQPATGRRLSEQETTGRALIARGRTVREVARRCGVAERTAALWAARVRATTATTAMSAGEGSTGGHRAPLQISHTTAPQPRTPTQEGPDPR